VLEQYYSVGAKATHADDVLGRLESDSAPVIERLMSNLQHRVVARYDLMGDGKR
jgi:hypothetical protein